VRRIRNPGVFVTAAVAIGAGVLVYAGCGGGGDDDASTSANATTGAIPTVTQPAQTAPNGGSTSTAPKAPESNRDNGAATGKGSPGGGLQQLSAFRECLSRQGVSLQILTGAGAARAQRRDPEKFRDQVEKAFTCIPALPPQLRQRAEQLKRSFEARQGDSGNSNG